jgi:signal transduction histidine kinase/DNA-binding response OmpR family regulator
MFFCGCLFGRGAAARSGIDMANSGGIPTSAPPVHPATDRGAGVRAAAEARRSALVLTGLFVAAATLFLLLPDALQARGSAGSAPRMILLRDGLFVAVVAVLGFVLVRRLLLPALPGDVSRTADAAPAPRPASANAAQLESLGRITAGLAHDVNNVFASVSGYAELALRRTPEDDPARVDLLAIRRATERGAGLTRKVLELGRPSAARPEVLDLNAVLVDLGRMLPRLMGEAVEVSVTPAPRPALLRADLTRLEQVVLNLALNARDALPHGGHLSLRAGVRDAGDGPELVLLEVSDDGAGMDEATRARIFEPFFTTRGDGTGLGLAMVAGYLAELGGSIECHSMPGRGTTFRILLPRIADEPQPAIETPAAARGGRETLLLVEDDDDLRSVLERVLAAAGYRVLAARGANEALEAARRPGAAPRLLITDVVLPGRSGVELAGRLAPLPALFISGHGAETLQLHGAPTEVLAKPFAHEALLSRVRARLDAAPAAARPTDDRALRATVLVVDDDAALCDVLVRMLHDAGHETRIALHGDQALATLQHGSIDVVVCDMLMPEKEGLETIAEMRRRRPALPIVAMSGALRGETYTSMAVKLGAVAELRKPFSSAELLDVIERALGARVPPLTPHAPQEPERV